MKLKNFILIIIILSIFYISCSDDATIMSVISDGKIVKDKSGVSFDLAQNTPNPFNPSTRIEFSVSESIHLCLKVYTEDWQEVKKMLDDEYSPAHYVVMFDGMNKKGDPLPSGEYFYTLEGNGYTLVRKMKLIK